MTISRDDIEKALTDFNAFNPLIDGSAEIDGEVYELEDVFEKETINTIRSVLQDRIEQPDNKLRPMSDAPKHGDIIVYNINLEPFIVCQVEDDYFTDGKVENHKSNFIGWIPMPMVRK